MADQLEVVHQRTPNPNAIKFTLNRTVSEEGKTYRGTESVESTWARQILGIPGIIQIYAVNNFISVTKIETIDWNVVIPRIESILKQAFA